MTLRRFIFSISILLIGSCSSHAQNKADSLITLLERAEDDSVRIVLLTELGNTQVRRTPVKAIDSYEEAKKLLEHSDWISDSLGLEMKLSIMTGLASAYSHVGEKQKNLDLLLEALEIVQRVGDEEFERSILANLGVEFQKQGMSDEALEYYRRGLTIAERQNARYGIAMALGNIGTCIGALYPDSTLHYYMKSLAVMDHPDMHDREGAMGWMMNNIGALFENHGQIDSAFHYYHMSEEIRESIDHRTGLCLIYKDLGELYMQVGNTSKALEYLNKSIRIGEENELMSFVKDSYLIRSELRSDLGDYAGAYEDHKMFLTVRDSVQNERDAKSLIQQTMTYEYDKKHLADSLLYEADLAVKAQEVRRQKVVRNGFMGGFALVAFFAGIFFFQRNRISKEKQRSEELLLNILPEEVAEELKEKGEAEAKLIDHVTVLFTDFKGFTAMSEKLRPRELVKDLNECFSAFDRISEKYGIEKIKTIGDAYMAAGGLPTPNTSHAVDIIGAAMEMRDFVEEGKQRKIDAGLPYFEIRIGVHTGPVVAGIVGVKKFQYDIWGDTVNTASRMESSGEEGKVNISQTTYELVKDNSAYDFEFRGKVKAKGKGDLKMYFVGKR